MSAGRPGVPAGPLESAPGGFVPVPERAVLLAGIGLGAWDRRIVAWMAGWDTCTVLTVASWIGRAREAGPRE